MNHLERKTKEWTDDKLADFMLFRYKSMTSGGGDICAPADAKVPSHAPFTDTDNYTHGKILGDIMHSADWQRIVNTNPRTLLHPNPFMLSSIRTSKLASTPAKSKYHFRCWDSAIGIPACKMRGVKTPLIQEVPSVRNINAHWVGTAIPSILRTGPLGQDGTLIRPHGPHIYDLTRVDRHIAWDILEMAHVMAHQYDEIRPDVRNEVSRSAAAFMQSHDGRLRGCLAEIVHAIMYGLPVDISLRNRNKPGEPDTYYHTELKSSTRFREPVLRLPWKTREAPRPDDTLSVALNAIFIQPHPHSFTTGTHDFTLDDMWCCHPTIVALVGWEGIDYITHAELGVNRWSRKRVNYIVRAEDLLPPDSYWAYLALAQRTTRGDKKPIFESPNYAVKRTCAAINRAAEAEDRLRTSTTMSPDEIEKAVRKAWDAERPNIRWMWPMKWLKSRHYRWLLRQTPPLPCPDCMAINYNAEGAPEKPKGIRPKGAKKDMPAAWKRYDNDLKKIKSIVQDAVVSYEISRYGNKEARIRRKTRRKLNAQRNKRIYYTRKAEYGREKQRLGHTDPTASERNAMYLVDNDLL